MHQLVLLKYCSYQEYVCVLYDVCSDLTFQIHTISDSY